jgi:hypothetical protein
MRILRARRGLAIACALPLALAVTLLVANNNWLHHRSHHERKVVMLVGAYAFHFDTLPEMVATSSTVVQGSVVSAARGRVIDEGDVTYTRRALTIQVQKRLAGLPVSGPVMVETSGWRQVDGEPETEFRVEGELPVSPGDSGIFFLYDFDRDGRYGFINDQGVLLAEGTNVLDTSREDPLVQNLETQTISGVQTLVNAAKAMISAGEVTGQSYPGG